jgi:hypothetical protein
MAKIYSTRKGTIENLERAGYYLDTYSPGDGVTRYRFFKFEADGTRRNDYFGPGNGLFTALGWREAELYAQGLIDAGRP